MKLSCLVAACAMLAAPIAAQAQFSSLKKMPSVARPAGAADPNCAKLTYPESARRADEQGTVRLLYVIAKDGAILDGKVVKSSGSYELDKAALVGIAKCNFKYPAGVEGPVQVPVEYTWQLE